MSKLIANQIQAIGGSALTLPTNLPSSDSTLKVNSSGVMSYEASAGTGATDTRVFCGSVDFKHDSGVGGNVLLSKPANLSADKIRTYEIHMYGIGMSSETSYNMRFRPYKGGSSVMTGNTWYVSGHRNYNGSSQQGFTHTWSSYLSPMYAGGSNYPYNNPGSGSADIQSSEHNNAYSGKFNAKIIYNNNKNYSSYQVYSGVRTSSNSYYTESERHYASASSNKTTTDYTEQFYFYPGAGNFDEGIISLYAIKKSDT